MSDANDQTPAVDQTTGLPLDRDALLASDEIARRLQSGELTGEQAAELLQAAQRRHTAEHGPDLDTNEEGVVTTGGFGSGQGMASQHGPQS